MDDKFLCTNVVITIASFLALSPVMLAADSVASTVMVDQPSVGVRKEGESKPRGGSFGRWVEWREHRD